MAVEILEAAQLHEAVSLWIARFAAARGERLASDIVYRLAAVGRNADQNFADLVGVGDLLWRELAELVVGQSIT